MAVADSKKVQTLINRAANEMAIIRAATARLEATRLLFVAANPDVTGTPLEGNVTTVGNAIAALKAEVDKAIWTGLIAARVPSHRGEAL